MNNDVFLSLLASNAYNRGYGQNVLLSDTDDFAGQNELGRSIGNASITFQSISIQAQAASFHASTYDWNGETIISYRGTPG